MNADPKGPAPALPRLDLADPLAGLALVLDGPEGSLALPADAVRRVAPLSEVDLAPASGGEELLGEVVVGGERRALVCPRELLAPGTEPETVVLFGDGDAQALVALGRVRSVRRFASLAVQDAEAEGEDTQGGESAAPAWQGLCRGPLSEPTGSELWLLDPERLARTARERSSAAA